MTVLLATAGATDHNAVGERLAHPVVEEPLGELAGREARRSVLTRSTGSGTTA